MNEDNASRRSVSFVKVVGIEVCTNRMLTVLFVLDKAAYVTLFRV
jgi:hypothetical protein